MHHIRHHLRKIMLTLSLALLLGSGLPMDIFKAQAADSDSRTAVEKANADLLRRWYETVLGPLNPDPADAFLAEDFVQHSKLAKPGVEGIKAFVRQMKTLWPNPKLTIKNIYADGDYVIGQVHQQRFDGDVGLNVVNIYRVENGRFKEHWGVLQPVDSNPLAK